MSFCAVVISTMFAAESFDPRLMWDVAEGRGVVASHAAATASP
jgi:uncharacterized paraquat-inducible protein A